MLNSNISSTCSDNTVNVGPLAAEIRWRVWGTPVNFNGFRVLAALLHGILVVGASQTAALNRERHLHSAGRLSRWHWPTFLVINDLDLNLLGIILKFADDSKIFGKAITPADRLQLQLDLDALRKWAEDWQMKFDISKCKVMHTGPRNTNCSYFMNGQLLNTVTEHKDLGVIISSTVTLKWLITVTMPAIKQTRYWD